MMQEHRYLPSDCLNLFNLINDERLSTPYW